MPGARAGDKLGKYQLVEEIGAGGMAEVWRADFRGAAGFRREVALKMIRPDCVEESDFLNMFADEARLSSLLTHPRIVQTLDFGYVDQRYFLAMELVDGASLRACQRALGRPLSPELACFITAELAAALDYAHHATGADGAWLGIVHRDISPANVLLSVHGDVKLADFGVAKAIGRSTQTEAGALKGKILYMSPEQAWGKPVDARSDLYTLGLLLYELLTGRRALEAGNEMLTLENARAPRIAALDASFDPALQQVLTRALAPAAAQRYARGEALRRDLLAVLARTPRFDATAAIAELVRPARQAARPARAGEAPAAEGTFEGTLLSGVAPPSAPSTVARPRRGRVVATVAAVAVAILGGAFAVRGARRRAEIATPRMTAAAPNELAAPTVDAPPRPAPVPADPPPIVRAASPKAHAAHAVSTAPAVLRVQVVPWGEVFVDGRRVGETPLRPLELPSGAHTIVAKNPGLGERRTELVLAGGESRLVKLSFSTENAHP